MAPCTPPFHQATADTPSRLGQSHVDHPPAAGKKNACCSCVSHANPIPRRGFSQNLFHRPAALTGAAAARQQRRQGQPQQRCRRLLSRRSWPRERVQAMVTAAARGRQCPGEVADPLPQSVGATHSLLSLLDWPARCRRTARVPARRRRRASRLQRRCLVRLRCPPGVQWLLRAAHPGRCPCPPG
jgi:hypothetical protein